MLLNLDSWHHPVSHRVDASAFCATGERVPEARAGGPRPDRGERMRHSTDTNPPTPATLPVAASTAARRAVIAAAVEAYNQANPDARLPRSAARLLLAMFPAGDEFRGSQELLRDAGF